MCSVCSSIGYSSDVGTMMIENSGEIFKGVLQVRVRIRGLWKFKGIKNTTKIKV